MKVINFVIVILMTSFFATNVSAQKAEKQIFRPSFSKNQISISGGIGMPALGFGNGDFLGKPTFILDYGLQESFSVGAFYIPHFTMTQKELGIVYSRKKFVTGARVLGHISKYERIDLYGGLQVGAMVTTAEEVIEEDYEKSASYELPHSYQGTLVFSPVLGARFQPVKHNYGAFFELGFNGTSFGTIGLSYRL